MHPLLKTKAARVDILLSRNGDRVFLPFSFCLPFDKRDDEEREKRKIKKTIEKQKSHFSEISIILTAGIYTVGIDFPQGKYTLTAKENYGDVITSDNVKNGINQTLGVGYRDIASEFNNLILENGDTLTIDGELVLKLYSQRVNLVVAPREVRGQEINLIAGNYICGKDFEEGTYDTGYGAWKYATIEDGQVNLAESDYLMIGTLESYGKLKKYYGAA